jgi:uncharacterized SAM-binding protein YcdF (DUF218 family)
MKVKTPLIVRLVRMAAVIFVMIGALMVFIYTPFYSQLMVSVLDRIVSYEVNETAAQSQQNAKLTEQESLEPGSELWIARQAYLKLMQDAIQAENPVEDLKLLKLRYQALQQRIEVEREAEELESDQQQVIVPMLAPEAASEAVISENVNDEEKPYDVDSSANKALMQQYLDFLSHYDVGEFSAASEIAVDELDTENDVATSSADAYAIVVLGGGLTIDATGKDIVVNDYTRLRLETILELKQKYDLPIVLSGVEAPYMQRWLAKEGVEAKLLENRSMNTCENSRFSALLLQKKGGAPKVMLVTDRYHMPRTRRLFAANGIETIPVEAPMPTQTTQWRPSEQNYHHSRRANYEMLATLRDIWLGSSDCREVP